MPRKTSDPRIIKPNHKAIQLYHQSLNEYRGVGVRHEGAVETAFQRLLDQIAKLHHCQLIPKHKLKVGGHTIFPDGTVFEKELGDLGLRLVPVVQPNAFPSTSTTKTAAIAARTSPIGPWSRFGRALVMRAPTERRP